MNKTNIESQVELFSFGIAAYNNYRYLKEAVDSVLKQDYARIELIISNDGSKDFDEEEITEYINRKKGSNIERVLINNNETNVGTVKNVNYICGNATGAYIMLMAADDALYNEKVLSRFADSFTNENKEAYCISGKVAMCGEELVDVMSYEPSAEGINAIKNLNSRQMFSKLSHTFIVPTTSTCYRTSLFEELGEHDEDCFIIEDAPLYIKMARKGYQFGWIDNFVAARHRDGGISHGNTRNKSETYRRYRFDEIVIYAKEILPYKELIYPEDLQLMEAKWKYIEGAYYREFLQKEDGTVDYREYDRAICEPLIEEMKKQCSIGTVKSQVKASVENISIGEYLKKIIKTLVFALLVSGIEKIVSVFDISILQHEIITEAALVVIYLSLMVLFVRDMYAVAIRILWKFYKLVRRR